MNKEQLNTYLKELSENVYFDYDIEKATRIYNDIIDNYDMNELKMDLYNLVPIMSYYIMVRDMGNLKKYIEFLGSKSTDYTKYELYFLYYFQAAYFHYNDYNTDGTLYAIDLIDINKFKRYINYDYIHYICGRIENLRGGAYYQNKQFDKAEEFLQKSLEYYQFPNSLGYKLIVLGNLATNLLGKGNFEEAAKIYYQIMSESHVPLHPTFIANLTLIEVLTGNISKAKFLFESITYDNINNKSIDSIFATNTYKHLGALLYYYLDDIKKSNEFLNSVNIEVSNDLNAGYFNKLITAFINKDYSDETVNLINNNIFPFFKKKNNTGNLKVCELYFEELDKFK